MTFRSEPSGFSETTRLSLRSRTNKRPTAALPPDARPDLDACASVIFYPFIINSCLNPRPEHLAGEAPRMDAQQRSALCQIAQDNRERGFDPSAAVRDIARKP